MTLHRATSGRASAILLVLPGGGCAADRYEWLFALTGAGIDVAILDGPTVPAMIAALSELAGKGLPIHVVGHSAGAATILDALEPGSNRLLQLPEGFALPVLPASVTSLGCSLQARVLDWDQKHRHETRSLHCPQGVCLTFVAGVQDAIASPEVVARTAVRYTDAQGWVMEGATHYGWAGGHRPGDRSEFDTDCTLDTANQRALTLRLIEDIVAGRTVRPLPGVSPLLADCRIATDLP